MTLTHYEALQQIGTDYRRKHGLKLANNTRLFEHMNGDYGVVLHGTEVVTIHRDDTYTLRSGGYRTVTTLDRIRRFGPPGWNLFSEGGEWFVRLKPNPNDPRPDRVERSIPKPYDCPEDPGPEPVKTHTGWTAREDVARDNMVCIAGMRTEQPYWEYKRLFEWSGTLADDKAGPGIYVSQRALYNDSDKLFKTAHVAGMERIFYGEGVRGYADEWWHQFTGRKHYQAGETHFVGDARWEYKQCPHCAEFDALHRRWKGIMYGGDGWGNRQRFDAPRGYDGYVKAIEQFGSREAWQAAYLEDLRDRRAYLAEDREWEQRNRVPFYDGITVDSEGYAPKLRADGPSPAKLRRHEAKVIKVKQQIKKYVDGYIEQLVKGMPMPGPGDCWYCLMFEAVPPNDDGARLARRGTTVEPAPRPHSDHLESHMKERYYVPSLAVNALRERGYKDVGIYLWLDMNADTNTMGGRDSKYDTVRRDLTKYLRKRLVPEAPTA